MDENTDWLYCVVHTGIGIEDDFRATLLYVVL
jgi:hypothetical protein